MREAGTNVPVFGVACVLIDSYLGSLYYLIMR